MSDGNKNKYMNLNEVPEEFKEQRKIRRKPGRTATMTACVFAIITLLAITGLVYSYLSLQQVKAEKAAQDKILAAFPDNYTQEQVDIIVAEAVQENTDDFLATMKEKLLSESSAVNMLRYFYPDELVAVYNNQYYFLPISETLIKNTYVDENFVKTESGEVEYYQDGVKISHKGIDISKYQGSIDWAKVKQDDVEFAFLRLGLRGYESGKLVLDETYVNNVVGATDAGVGVGVYFFTQAITVEEAVEEADFVLENIKDYNITYPVVFDIEDLSSEDARTKNLTVEENTAITIAFCERIKEAGYKPMIYGNLKTFLLMLDMEQLEGYEKWFAYYDLPVYFPYAYSILQYSEKGVVDGIEEPVDMNISFE